ncbi:unnamed protein product [Effrenium voratum]|uniref:Xaa-Pro dipeptidyl-peptidase-like domain-containing protein n=1 Tax=Effrenium voratum TaxID=2562239 RepID=A0AA36I0U7_9DINO|nr:unnamed protein product [Effrenium voratum]
MSYFFVRSLVSLKSPAENNTTTQCHIICPYEHFSRRISIKSHTDGARGVTPRCDFTVTSIDTAIVDGIILRGSLLLPKGLEGPFPSVLLRTPYGRKAEMGQSVLARQGYAVLVQDTRGRFSSSGEFVPVQHEQMDGEATVAWMRKQPWCSGKVGVTGASYLGFTAWACVDGAQVDAIVPMITQSNIRSAVFRPGGAVSFELVVLWFYLVLHLMKDLGHDRWSFFKKLWQGMREGKLRRAFASLPMSKVDEIILGSTNNFLQDGLSAHGDTTSRFWEGKDKLCRFDKAVPPCHILTGGASEKDSLRLKALNSLVFKEHTFCDIFRETKRRGEKIVKRGGPGGGLLMVACSGFYVNLKSVFPLIRFEKGVFRELIYRFR